MYRVGEAACIHAVACPRVVGVWRHLLRVKVVRDHRLARLQGIIMRGVRTATIGMLHNYVVINVATIAGIPSREVVFETMAIQLGKFWRYSCQTHFQSLVMIADGPD